MNLKKTELAKQAAHKALTVRVHRKRTLYDPVSPIDLAVELGVQVRFKSLPSMNGIYSPVPTPTIVIGSERPAVRQNYTAAHELGHHVFEHGTKVDEYVLESHQLSEETDEEEFLAQVFAGFLLMPQIGIQRAFKIRGWTIESAGPVEYFTVANYFGTGYKTLLNHLRHSCRLIGYDRFNELYEFTPSKIREILDFPGDPVILVDQHWDKRVIDLEVGDFIKAPANCSFDGLPMIGSSSEKATVFEAIQQGSGILKANDDSWKAIVRIRPHKFTGLAIYRSLDPVEDDE